MSHSMQTTNFNLPLFADNDSPTWLGDFNEAMGTMDTAMAKVSNDSNSQVNAIANLTTRVEDAEEKVAGIDRKVKGYDAAIAGKAPTMHADATVTYGAASGTLYGHVRLEDVPGNYGAGDGRAATPRALKAVNDAAAAAQSAADAAKKTADTANTAAQNAQKAANDASSAASDAASKANAADRKAQQALDTVGMGGTGGSGEYAPVSHADTTTKYGSASSTKYGHVKLTDTITSSGSTYGIAATPKAVKDYVDQNSGGTPQIRHISQTTKYGPVDVVYDERTKLVVVRVYITNYSIGGGENAEFTIYTLPSELWPKRQYMSHEYKDGHGGSLSVDSSGKIMLYHDFPSIVNTNLEVVYFAGV